MKKCPYCGEENQDEASVCEYCGRDLVPPLTEIEIKKAKKKKKKKKKEKKKEKERKRAIKRRVARWMSALKTGGVFAFLYAIFRLSQYVQGRISADHFVFDLMIGGSTWFIIGTGLGFIIALIMMK